MISYRLRNGKTGNLTDPSFLRVFYARILHPNWREQMSNLRTDNEQAIHDITERQLEEKRTEIDGLKAEIEGLKSAARAYLASDGSLGQAVNEAELKASIQVQVYEETIRILRDQITRRNELIYELLEWMDSEFRLDTHPPESPGYQLWARAHEAIK